MSDIGHLTYGVLDNALDLFEAWQRSPQIRDQFGRAELRNIEEAKERLAELEQFILIHMNRKLKGVA